MREVMLVERRFEQAALLETSLLSGYTNFYTCVCFIHLAGSRASILQGLASMFWCCSWTSVFIDEAVYIL